MSEENALAGNSQMWQDVSPVVFRYLAMATELETVLREILVAGAKFSNADRAAVYLYDPERD
ncbi:MAG: hypothetical protein D6793_09100, partial [Thermoflexia bacterium]